MRHRIPRRPRWPALFIVVAATPASLMAQSVADTGGTLTLERALEEARQANALLPVSQMQVQAAVARAREARGLLLPTLSLDADLHAGTPQKYASSDAMVRVLADAPIYEGGALRAGVARGNAEADASRAGYRMTVRDVDYGVRATYSRILRADSSLAFHQRAIRRLESYLSVVQGRQAAGQGVGSDVLRTRQRLVTARADAAAVAREVVDARMALNDLLGRAPGAPLTLGPLPLPSAPGSVTGEPWLATPDVAQSEAAVRAGEADLRAARSGRLPHVRLEADAGAQPVLGSDVALLNNGTGWGTQVLLTFSLPFWDFGVHAGRVDAATASLHQARQQGVVVRRAARLAWTRAAADLATLYDEYGARDTAAAVARDSYLQAESLYRGGQGTALDVLDAYDAWVQANQDLLNVIYNCRVVRADLERWGTP
jgi:outer membrane protein TolC